jgi:stage V sporulation protein D (sporulation-specific penicillin-binding protein)
LDIKVPSLIGQELSVAENLLKKKNLSYRLIGNGNKVVDQVPKASHSIPATGEVLLYTETTAPTEQVEMPDLSGLKPEKANKVLLDLGLFMKATGALSSSGTLTAAFQTIEPGELIAFGSTVEIEFRDQAVNDSGRVINR